MPPTLTDGPVAPIAAELRRLHGSEWTDPYAWLRQRDAPEVRAHLAAENAYTEAVLERSAELRRQLYEEMVSRLPGDDCTVPARIDGYLYYERLAAGSEHPVHCRRRDLPDAPEEVLLDLEALSRDRPFLTVGAFAPSPDHRYLAYSLDSVGAERFVIHLRDLASGETLPLAIPDTSPSLVWANDARTFFYVTLDAQLRPHAVRRHRLGDDPATDELVLREDDARYFVSLFQTRSRRFLGILLESKVTSEVHLAEDRPRGADGVADGPPGPFRCRLPRQPGVELRVEHRGEHLFVMTNEEACDFRVVALPVASGTADGEDGREVVPERPGTAIESIDCFRDHLVLTLRRAGNRLLEVHELGAGAEPVGRHEVPIDEPVFTAGVEPVPGFDTTTLRFSYSSLVTPATVVDYDMARRELVVRKVAPVPGYEASRYRSERRWAVSEDGTRVPVSLVYRPDRGSLPRPTLLYAYGAYGISVEPRFSAARVSLLDRGLVYAIAHARGGGECGRRWYEGGKLAAKERTFEDVVAVARELVASGVARRRRLALRGGSAGGMTVGTVLARAGELFRAALAEVPFVDVLNTMLDPSIPLTVTEYDEWGDPAADPETFARIRAYSPYENVAAGPLPHLLVTAGLHDPRVQYWEPTKWVARLRAAQRELTPAGVAADGERHLLLRVDMESGHRGASGRYRALGDEALKLAFLLDALGAGSPEGGAGAATRP